MLDQLTISILNLDEHLVEPVDQFPDFVVTGVLDAHIVAMLARDGARGRGEAQERLRDDSLQPGRQHERQAERAEEGKPQDSQVLATACTHFFQVGLHVHGADRFGPKPNRPADSQ